jgi:general secretion pathway protein G
MVTLHRVSALGARPGGRRGFTLIEVLAVMAIVAVLLTLALPRLLGQVEASKDSVLRENLRTTRQVIAQFYGDQGRYPESLDELVERKYLQSLPFDPVTESNSTWRIEAVPEGQKGRVYDLRSGATGTARDGTPYEQW